jgi:hypothetical protein
MLKKYVIFLVLFLPCILAGEKRQRIDSLATALTKATRHQGKCAILAEQFKEYTRTDLDKAVDYHAEAMQINAQLPRYEQGK